jgi:hypothetical protein
MDFSNFIKYKNISDTMSEAQLNYFLQSRKYSKTLEKYDRNFNNAICKVALYATIVIFIHIHIISLKLFFYSNEEKKYSL